MQHGSEPSSSVPESTASPPDELRAAMRGMWAAVAGGWAEHADYIESRSAGLTARMLELCQLQPGARVLELACGPGSVGHAAAAQVSPGGEIVLSDVVPEMTEIAAARASSLGLTNVTTRVLDLEAIDEPNGSYDAVLCREGLMFVPSPERAAGEIWRILRPAGRFAIAVWAPRERNPWLACLLDAVSAQIAAPVPPLGVPGPFALADAERLRALFSDAGFQDTRVEEVEVPMRAESFEEWWERTTALAGPVAKLLESLPADAYENTRDRARRATAAYEAGDRVEFPGVTLLAGGRRS
jgi:ubiquinone/menaquinone biosynthesis C-methylase UbiE